MHFDCAARGTYLNCWCSLELRILEENLSASFSKLREYSSSISALRRKNSCRSCSSWIRDSDCCSKHLNCSTSWLRISVNQNTKQNGISQLFTLLSQHALKQLDIMMSLHSIIMKCIISLFAQQTICVFFSQVSVSHIYIKLQELVFELSF